MNKSWHERSALQSVTIRWSNGNNISVNIFFPLLFFSSSLFPLFYPSRHSLIEGVLGSKNLFSESDWERPITKVVAILDFAGSAVLQAVNECPRLHFNVYFGLTGASWPHLDGY